MADWQLRLSDAKPFTGDPAHWNTHAKRSRDVLLGSCSDFLLHFCSFMEVKEQTDVDTVFFIAFYERHRRQILYFQFMFNF